MMLAQSRTSSPVNVGTHLFTGTLLREPITTHEPSTLNPKPDTLKQDLGFHGVGIWCVRLASAVRSRGIQGLGLRAMRQIARLECHTACHLRLLQQLPCYCSVPC